ncbi:MAG: glutamate 5-kinase, partial [Firmicutes bacterium]|nr:glutamate 5-kinase [Bacillota bacterium]
MGRDRRVLAATQRLVVKVGTSSITTDGGRLNVPRMRDLAGQLAELRNRGKEVLLVSSGAIGAGLGRLGLTRRPRNIPEYQALAAVGQGILMHVYEQIFSEYGIVVGQVLLTREDFADRRRFLNARHTLTSLLQFGAIPIINENDTVAVDEIKFGDNDNL